MRVFLSVKKVTKTNAFLKSFKKRTKEILLKILLLSIIGTPYTSMKNEPNYLLQFDERKILEEYSTCMPKVIGEYLTVTQVSNVSKQKRNSRWGRGGLGAICLLASRKLLDIGCAHASSFQRVCSWFKNYERFH